MSHAPAANPYPGLRPFGPDEDHLFFGREREIDELLRRLRVNRFLSVVGTSGCGKSSLILCGLISSLHGGMMARAGSSWRVCVFRPGEDPIGHLAGALDAPDAIGSTEEDLASTNRVLIEAALRRGPRGLIEAVRIAHLDPADNVLVVVDQFEELFRFQRSRHHVGRGSDPASFVRLLLDASNQNEVPIYVVITMRSDFIGDCMEYPGLPEALNSGQYLVPRMSRDQLRSAITGPAAVAGAQIAPRLVPRLLNDLGSDQDQLPVLQHALMRTWAHWAARFRPDDPIDLQDYEAVGGLGHALSLHAEEAYEEAGGEGRPIVERIFKAITDTVSDARGTRRPSSVAELTAVAGRPMAEVVRVIEIFRRPGRSFLMPPAAVPLDGGVIVDLSHESLMRCWTRLIGWAEEERLSATMYMRVSRAAAWFDEGTAGLWRDPELELGLRWRRENQPTEAWTRRYGEPFDRAMRFLDRSEEARDRAIEERRAEKRRQWRQLQATAALLAVLLIVAIGFAVVAFREEARARNESARAEGNLRLARAAVDASLTVTDREPARLAVDFPEFVRFRRQLLEEAQRFYRDFVDQAPADAELRSEMAFASLQLAHIDRALTSRALSAARYRQAIAQFESLVALNPGRPDYRRALANAYNWLGETLRLSGSQPDAAMDAYSHALRLQDALVRELPGDPEIRRDLARTHYNIGILRTAAAGPVDGGTAVTEQHFLDAIGLLEPLTAGNDNEGASQDLGRAYNNLATFLLNGANSPAAARHPYARAVAIHQQLVARHPDNREYAVELVKFYNNEAYLLAQLGMREQAAAGNAAALALVETLARPAPSLSIERADSHTLRATIFEASDPGRALAEYREAFAMFQNVEAHDQAARLPEFHTRVGDLLQNLSFFAATPPGAGGRQTLAEGVAFYLDVARRAAASGQAGEARSVIQTLERVLPGLPQAIQKPAATAFKEIEPRLRETAASVS